MYDQVATIKNLKEKVIHILEKYPETRNDDALLTFYIIGQYLGDELIHYNEKAYISTYALGKVREDHVKRIRAIIQNEEGKFLPTNENVRRKRKISEESWCEYLNKNPEMRTV